MRTVGHHEDLLCFVQEGEAFTKVVAVESMTLLWHEGQLGYVDQIDVARAIFPARHQELVLANKLKTFNEARFPNRKPGEDLKLLVGRHELEVCCLVLFEESDGLLVLRADDRQDDGAQCDPEHGEVHADETLVGADILRLVLHLIIIDLW